MAAHTALTHGKRTLGWQLDGDVDLDLNDYVPGHAIQWIYVSGNIGDFFCVKDGAGGPMLLNEPISTGDGKFVPVYAGCRPFLDYSECTFGTPAECFLTVCF